MANSSRKGFWPSNNSTSSHNFHVRRCEVVSAYGTGLFYGDPIAPDTTGAVIAGTTNGAVLGISHGASYVLQLGNGARRISAKYLPASTSYSPTARGSENASYIFIYDDPAMEYEVEFSAALTSDYYTYQFNNAATTTATAGSTTTGISGYVLDSTTLVTTEAQWRISELQYGKADNDVSLTAAKAIVQYNQATSAGGGSPLITSAGV